MLPLEDSRADQLLTTVPEEARAECWWLVLRDGTPIPGDAGGGVALLAEVHSTHSLARTLRALQASAVVDAVDKVAARYRSRLGRLVPDGPAPSRYP